MSLPGLRGIMNLGFAIAAAFCFAAGFGAAWFRAPALSPATLWGVALIGFITIGYMVGTHLR
jgi:hypothetical protein